MFAGAASMKAVESDSVFGAFQDSAGLGGKATSDSATLAAGVFGRMVSCVHAEKPHL